MKKVIFFFVLSFFSINAFATDIATDKMLLRGVDKTTGRVKTMTATVNKPLEFGNLTIIPERCLTKPQEEMPENAVFLNVFEKTTENKKAPVFRGWMFSSNPALSSMEHPVYDVWLLECQGNDITTSIVAPQKIEHEDDLNLIAEEDNPALASDDMTDVEIIDASDVPLQAQ